MKSRISHFRSAFRSRQLNAFLVTNPVNIRYLTDYPAQDAWLLITKRNAYYLADSRYTDEVRKNLKAARVVKAKNSLVETTFELLKKERARSLGFESRFVTYALYRTLQKKKNSGLTLKPTEDAVEEIREIKDKAELKLFKKALKIHHEAYRRLKRWVKPGRSEREVYQRLENFVRSRNAGFSFDPIVASGPHSSYPHAKLTGRKFTKNDIVLIDMGVDVDGYKSDLTRMFYLGKISELILRADRAVKQAQADAIAAVKSGVPAKRIDEQARKSLAKKNLDKRFTHASGHGVGLDIHESPSLSAKSSSRLREGMVITVEPAVYFPHKFGIRHEEMVLVKDKGCEVLSADIH